MSSESIVVVPEEGTRRARRLSALALAQAPAGDTPIISRKQLRQARVSESGVVTASVVTAADLIAEHDAAVAAAPVRRRDRRTRSLDEVEQTPLILSSTAADVVAVAAIDLQNAAPAIPAEIVEPPVETPAPQPAVDAEVPSPEDAVAAGPSTAGTSAAATDEAPADIDFELASMALSLSALAIPTRAPGLDPHLAYSKVAPWLAEAPDHAALPDLAARITSRRELRAAAAARPAPVTETPTEADDDAPVALRRSPSTSSSPVVQWVPRLAVLSALGIATVGLPIHAWAGADEAPVELAPELAASSALDTLVVTPEVVEAAAAATPEASAGDATAQLLASDPLAETRSAVVASRSEAREGLPQCGEPEAAQPNGALAALESNDYITMSMPVQSGVYRSTSTFGPRWGSVHYGTDMAAPVGTPIHAIADGVVTYAGPGRDGRSSNIVVVEHEIDGEKVESWYVHMFNDGVFVEAGDVVRVGDVIAAVGNNGNSTGPHLHLEIHVGNLSDTEGSAVEPLAFLERNGAVPITTSGAVCA